MKHIKSFYHALEAQPVNILAEQLYVYVPERALAEVAENARQRYMRHAGMLIPYQTRDGVTPTYYGGLTIARTLFVLLPFDLVHARRWHYLRSLAACMGIKNQEQLDTYCEEAIQEVINDPSPRQHPALEADRLARQVAPWVKVLASRKEPQTPDWRW